MDSFIIQMKQRGVVANSSFNNLLYIWESKQFLGTLDGLLCCHSMPIFQEFTARDGRHQLYGDPIRSRFQSSFTATESINHNLRHVFIKRDKLEFNAMWLVLCGG